MGRLIPLLLVAGCLRSIPVENAFPPVSLVPPEITEATLICDAERARWELDLVVRAWTGGATSAWTADGEYVEIHEFDRKSWADDGSREALSLSMPIVDDWREVSGNSTAFTCAQDPSGVLEVYDTHGAVSDCRYWGPDPALLDELDDTPAPCATELPFP